MNEYVIMLYNAAHIEMKSEFRWGKDLVIKTFFLLTLFLVERCRMEVVVVNIFIYAQILLIFIGKFGLQGILRVE